ncbi:hypothetical protein PNEG_03031 [Pneumocystis murina B123]|uniref:Uncharacterized protein n=1 Tax=Pneumocystis murina (strain B123) TaxID=1069680 RepID=M7P3V9_PNEMU|nr:hypothetical protein PNEG_03031 [Pneumocystis murina B123]EMR08550.2 hypothetical protein PNEG_03031 [Pneumocystis murina B123]
MNYSPIQENKEFRELFPMSFGKRVYSENLEDAFKRTKREDADIQKIHKKNPLITKKQRDSSDSESNYEEEEDDFPISHEIVLKDHTKPISALSLDPSGTRIVSGSYDSNIKMWDFSGMSSTLNPFRTLEVVESQHVHYLEWNTTGDALLFISANSQAKILDREGEEISECVKGDPYLRDLKHTSGHISELTSGCWNPVSYERFMTSSVDSTVRLWNMNQPRKNEHIIVHKSKTPGKRMKVYSSTYSHDATFIATADNEGTLSLWAAKGPFHRPMGGTILNAHEKETHTSCISFLPSGNLMVTRGGDHTVKLWDIRKFKEPLSIRNQIENNYPETNIAFSPNGEYILTGSSIVTTTKDIGKLVILKTHNLEIVKELSIHNSAVIRTLWHTKINQILAGTANAAIHVLYSPKSSIKGAKLVLAKAPKIQHIDDDSSLTIDIYAGAVSGSIILPNGKLDETADTELTNARREKSMIRKDPIRSRIPSAPARNAPGGRGNNPDENHVKNSISLISMRDEDPREALLKYAELAEKDPIFTGIYKENQPNPIFADHTEDTTETIKHTKKNTLKPLS